MRIELCMPALNEASIIDESARRVRAVLDTIPGEHVLVVVDNGSTDGTAHVVRAIAHPQVRLYELSERGKGRAVVHAAQKSDADVFGFIDADLSAEPEDIRTLLAALEGGAHIAIGSRLQNPLMVERHLWRTLASRLFNLLRKLTLGVSVRDSQCGLKLMTCEGRAQLAQCKETGWFFDVELLARAERAGLRVSEVPVRWQEERFKGRASKLRVVRDGIQAVLAFARIRQRLAVE